MSSNLHPVDEIQKIREQVKALKAREAELKAMIVSGEASKEGQFVRAQLITRKSKRFNRQAAEVCIPRDLRRSWVALIGF